MDPKIDGTIRTSKLSLIALAAVLASPVWAQGVPPANGKAVPPSEISCKAEDVAEDVHIKEFVLKKTDKGWSAVYRNNHKWDGKPMSLGTLECRFHQADARLFACHRGTKDKSWRLAKMEKETTAGTSDGVWIEKPQDYQIEYLKLTFEIGGKLDPEGEPPATREEAHFLPSQCKIK